MKMLCYETTDISQMYTHHIYADQPVSLVNMHFVSPSVLVQSNVCCCVANACDCSAGRGVETGWFGRKKRTVAIADAVTLGDSWLGPAIKAGYLQPLQDVTGYRWWVSTAQTTSL